MNKLDKWQVPRLDNSFDDRPIERIQFYVFAVRNNSGVPFRWFTTREKADGFISRNKKFCRPGSVLVEVE